MYRKLLISAVIFLACIFTFSICLANDNGAGDAAQGIRDVVGGAENAIEDAARDISNTSKDATGDLEKDGNSMGNNDRGNSDNNTGSETNGTTSTDNNSGSVTNARTNSDNGNYTATRTTTTGDSTFMGMNATAWTWLILGIAAIAIIALVWYYSMQLTSSSNYDNKD